MSIKKLSFMLLSAISLAALLNGCGSSSKDGSPGGVARVADEGVCIHCHSTSVSSTSGTSIVGDYGSAAHNPANVSFAEGCEGCHGGGSQHNGVGPFPYANPLKPAVVDGVQYATVCRSCHTPAHAEGKELDGLFAVAAAEGFSNRCAHCHTKTGVGSIHGAGNTDPAKGCIDCHDVAAPQHGSGLVNDNNGVRAIIGEFGKTSHHVTGRAVQNSDCAVCHLEGKESGGSVVIDTDFHMKDDKIYLRNCNISLTGNQSKSLTPAGNVWTGGKGNPVYAWEPSAPDYTVVDQFCFSCHNASGAPDAVADLAGVQGYDVNHGGTATALNPFGDSVSNGYDQVSRLAVVNAYDQFDTGNSSHHAVRGARYTTNTLSAATFTNISTNNYNFQLVGVPAPIKGIKSYIGTMSSLGKFNTLYTTLSGTALADTATLHCGDCHTVGQNAPGTMVDSTTGIATTVAIGAHGSNNEYLLKNAYGTDTFNKDALVCYVCHNVSEYGDAAGGESTFNTAATKHNNANNADGDCNGAPYNTAGMTGLTRLQPQEGALSNATFQAQVAAGNYYGTGGANILGIKCANCHNASDKKAFGGIHGNAYAGVKNASYNSYSGAKTVAGATAVVARKPYRFMPGLGNMRYNGGDTAAAWTVKTVSSSNKNSCYTLNGLSTSKSRTTAVNAGANISATGLAGSNDNGILGSWGACTDHAGTSVLGGQHDPSRTVLRPQTY